MGDRVPAFTVSREEVGQTLAAVLRKRLGATWREAEGLIEKRRVRLDGRICAEPARRLKLRERLEVVDAPPTQRKRPAKPIDFGARQSDLLPDGIIVRFSDDQVLVVEKPAGLTSMRHAEEAAEFGSRARKYLPSTLADFLPRILGDNLPVIAVHRLDRETSGLVVFARSAKAAKHLDAQFRAHTTERAYLAIVRGTPREGEIISWLIRDRGDGRRGSGPEGQGQRAVTHVRLLQNRGPLSLVECRLETGRTHQVRIHLGELGCPLAGERIYDRPIHGKPAPDPSGAKRFALHAASLGFIHPASGKLMRFQSELPDDMKSIIALFAPE